MLSVLSPALWAIFDAASAAFALAFYIFVVGLGLYGIASVVYNLVLLHKRRNLLFIFEVRIIPFPHFLKALNCDKRDLTSKHSTET